MKKKDLSKPSALDSLRNVLTQWQERRYDRAVMEIAELKRQIQRRRERLEQEIKRLSESLEECDKQLQSLEPVETLMLEYELLPEDGVDFRAYVNMTQEEAVLTALKSAGEEPLNAKAVTAQLKEGGYRFKTENPLNSVSVLLNRMAQAGKIVSEKTEGNGVCFALPMVRTK